MFLLSNEFRALIVYDHGARTFPGCPPDGVGLGSCDTFNMKVDASGGSVDISIGPEAPQGLGSDRNPAKGKQPFRAMQSCFPDLEPVEQ